MSNLTNLVNQARSILSNLNRQNQSEIASFSSSSKQFNQLAGKADDLSVRPEMTVKNADNTTRNRAVVLETTLIDIASELNEFRNDLDWISEKLGEFNE